MSCFSHLRYWIQSSSLKPRTIRIGNRGHHWRTRVKNWLLVVAWAGLITYFSTDHFSSLNTSEIFQLLLSWLFPNMPTEDIGPVHGAIRKLAHLGEYFILAVLFLWALQNENGGKWKLRHVIHTLIFVFLYASGDEFHQSFVPTRTASFRDVMINALGGICGISWTYRYGKGILAPLTSQNKGIQG